MEFSPTLSLVLKFAITLVSIMNPIGVIPVFLGFTKNNKSLNISKITNACSVAVGSTLILSLIAGQHILNFFGISVASFTIGGGILLSTIAFSMIQGQLSNTKINDDEIKSVDYEKEIGVIPLAIPLLSGPGAISTSIIHSKNFSSPFQWIGAVVVVILVSILVKYVLTYADNIGNKLGPIGLNVLTRIMGLILLAMSIEMIASGFKEILPILKGSIAFMH